MKVPNKIRILTVDDNDFIQLSLKRALDSTQEITVVAQAHTKNDAIALYQEHQPDIVLMDLMLNQTTGIEVSEEILKLDPNARIFMLSAFFKEECILSAVRLGVVGYLLKDVSVSKLSASLITSYNGERVFASRIEDLIKRDNITSTFSS